MTKGLLLIGVATMLCNESASAQALYAINNGNWNHTSTWSTTQAGQSCNCIPTTSNDVYIENGFTVFLNVDASVHDLSVSSGGHLQWSSHNVELNIRNGGTLQIGVGSSLNENGRFNAELKFPDVCVYTLLIDGLLVVDDIDVSGHANLTFSGIGNIDIRDDLELIASSSVTNNLSGSFYVNDDFIFSAANSVFTNNGNLTVNRDLILNNADDALFSNGHSASLIINADLEAEETTERFLFQNEGFVSIGNDLKESPSGINACRFYNLENASLHLGHTNQELDWKLYASYPDNTVNYSKNNPQNFLFDPVDGSYWHLTFSGTSRKRPSSDLNLNGNLSIADHAFLDLAFYHNNVNIGGDWLNSSTNSDAFREGNGTIVFDGTQNQLISSTNGEHFQNLTIDTEGAIILDQAVYINIGGVLSLIDGYVFTSSNDLLILEDDATSNYGSPSSFVDGPMRKVGDEFFIFPTGKNGQWGRIAISVHHSVTASFDAEYFNADPHAAGYDRYSLEAGLNNVSSVEYWILDRTSGSDAVQVGLFWEDAQGASFIDDLSDLRVARFNSADLEWKNEGSSLAFGGIGNGASGLIMSNYVTTFSPFTFASISSGSNPLPVELIEFEASLLNDQVMVDWATATETNNSHFIVERSTDNVNFEGIEEVPGNGTTNSLNHYRMFDEHPLEGISYYRLKQEDFDGGFTYSSSQTIYYVKDHLTELHIYPNPVTSDEVQVTLNGFKEGKEFLLVLRDVAGQEHYSKVVFIEGDGYMKSAIPISSDLENGVYLIVAASNDELLMERIVVR